MHGQEYKEAQEKLKSALAELKKAAKGSLIGLATEDQVAAWKKEYPKGIYGLEVDGHIGYFKNPGRAEMNCAMSKVDKDAALDMFEDLAQTTFIGGSEAVLVDDEMFYGIVQQIKVKMEGKKAIMVNL